MIECEECKKFFDPKNKNQRFCSGKCAKSNNGKKNKGRKFSDEINKKKGLKGEKNPFYGKKHTDETKNKIGNANKGRKFSDEINKKKGLKGEKNPFYGKHLSDEHKAKISENHQNCKGKNNPMYGKGYLIAGEKNGSWNGGISLIYGDEFTDELKTKIRKRDKFKCAICGQTGYDVHHIDYDKFNNLNENLITLCRSDHVKTNFNREGWIQFFKTIINERK